MRSWYRINDVGGLFTNIIKIFSMFPTLNKAMHRFCPSTGLDGGTALTLSPAGQNTLLQQQSPRTCYVIFFLNAIEQQL